MIRGSILAIAALSVAIGLATQAMALNEADLCDGEFNWQNAALTCIPMGCPPWRCTPDEVEIPELQQTWEFCGCFLGQPPIGTCEVARRRIGPGLYTYTCLVNGCQDCVLLSSADPNKPTVVFCLCNDP